jgi:hypothetical protein
MGLASILHSVLKPFTLVVAVFFLTIAFLFAVVIYRLYFSPLSKFPGPSLAAITSAYEGYFDCFKDGGGRYYVEINRMHDLYGMLPKDFTYSEVFVIFLFHCHYSKASAFNRMTRSRCTDKSVGAPYSGSRVD